MAANRTRLGGIVIGVNVLLAAIWWLVPLWTYGVFDDGLFYSSIARNLVYDAQATIWDLKVSNTLDPQFNGHLPFSFWLQALLYRLVGDVYWLDRLYGLLLALGAMGLLVACWRLWQPQGGRLPLLFWLSVSIVGWSFGNNMLENLLTVTTAASAFLLVRQAKQARKNWSWIALAGGFLFAATMTKGPVGLYPLAVPLLYALVLEPERWKRALLETLLLLGVLLGSYFLLIMLWPRAAVFLEKYWQIQLVGALVGEEGFTDGRWAILRAVLEESIPSLLIGLAILGSVRYLKLPALSVDKKTALFFFLLALSASLPMLVSPKQLRFYVVPSMLWYALAWGVVCWPSFLALAEYTQTWKRRKMTLQSVVGFGVLVCLALSIKNIGSIHQQDALLKDAHRIGTTLPPRIELFIPASLYDKWSLHGYFYRYFYIDLSTAYHRQPYAIGPKDEDLTSPTFEAVTDTLTDLNYLQVYQHRD
jgi:4-amino-4-deoxy-L-arabinose transferase-like glycosyltransferase